MTLHCVERDLDSVVPWGLLSGYGLVRHGLVELAVSFGHEHGH